MTVYHSDLGMITAKDDCDLNPTWEIDTSTLTDGQDIPIETPHLVQVNAEDWMGKVGVGYIKVLAKPSCEPVLDSNVCYGSKYYRLISASDIGEDPVLTRIPWTTFFTSTLPGGPLENCVLAPVTSDDDLNQIKAAAGQERFTIVGVRKPANDVVNDAPGGSSDGWKNIDGTFVPSEAWGEGEPDMQSVCRLMVFSIQ